MSKFLRLAGLNRSSNSSVNGISFRIAKSAASSTYKKQTNVFVRVDIEIDEIKLDQLQQVDRLLYRIVSIA